MDAAGTEREAARRRGGGGARALRLETAASGVGLQMQGARASSKTDKSSPKSLWLKAGVERDSTSRSAHKRRLKEVKVNLAPHGLDDCLRKTPDIGVEPTFPSALETR